MAEHVLVHHPILNHAIHKDVQVIGLMLLRRVLTYSHLCRLWHRETNIKFLFLIGSLILFRNTHEIFNYIVSILIWSTYFKLNILRSKFTVNPWGVPVNCKWSDWSTNQCTKTCGGGQRTKTRTKKVSEKNGGTCSGTSSESEACNTQRCSGNVTFVIRTDCNLFL